MKSLSFVSWKKHKLEEAMEHTDAVLEGMFDSLVFEIVIDFLRKEYGFPGALPVSDFTKTSPVIPPPPFILPQSGERVSQEKCPCCGKVIAKDQLVRHMSQCRKELTPERAMEVLAQGLAN